MSWPRPRSSEPVDSGASAEHETAARVNPWAAARYAALAAVLLTGVGMAALAPGMPAWPGVVAGVLAEPALAWLGLAFWHLGAIAWGAAFTCWRRCRDQSDALDFPLQWTLGIGAQLALFWIVGHLFAVNPLTAWGVVLGGAAAAACRFAIAHRAGIGPTYQDLFGRPRRATDGSTNPSRSSPSWLTVVLVAPVGMMLVAALCSPGMRWATEAYGYDVLSYHLQLPREWLQTGRIAPLQHNVYSFLPSLLESGYAHQMALTGVSAGAIQSALLHLSLGLLAVWVLAGLIRRWTGSAIAGPAAALLMTVPWFWITGTLAYNEMGMLLFAAAACRLMLGRRAAAARPGANDAATNSGDAEDHVDVVEAAAIDEKERTRADVAANANRRPGLGGGDPLKHGHGERAGEGAAGDYRAAAAAGFLLGLACLSKLVAGPLLAAPLALGCVTLGVSGWRRRTLALGVLSLALLLTISPYLVRNTIHTGNPVFPLMTEILGRGHWSEALARRWRDAHDPPDDVGWNQLAPTLADQWFLNAGYGAIGGRPQSRDSEKVARFDRIGGFPLFWLAVILAFALAAIARPRDPLTWACAALILFQILLWWTMTHHQSRFLLVTLLPAAVLLGVGGARANPRAAATTLILLALTLTAHAWTAMMSQARPAPTGAVTVGRLDDSHPLDAYKGKKYLVADVSRLLYIDGPVTYHTAFDRSPLGDAIRRGEPTAWLQQTGHRYLWIHFGELQRLHQTYGYDPAVTPASLARIARRDGWRVVERFGDVALIVELPTRSGGGG